MLKNIGKIEVEMNMNKLITKAKNLATKKIILTDEEMQKVESVLDIILPGDFKEINKKLGYESFLFFEFFSFDMGVINKTKTWRKTIDLPNQYLVLSDDGESAVLLNTQDANNSTVIWCSLEDVLNLCSGKTMKYSPTIFKSFTDFYNFLLTRV